MKIDVRNPLDRSLIGLIEATLDGQIVKDCAAADDSAGWVEIHHRPYRIEKNEALTYRKYGSVRIRFRSDQDKALMEICGLENRRFRNLFAAPAGDEA